MTFCDAMKWLSENRDTGAIRIQDKGIWDQIKMDKDGYVYWDNYAQDPVEIGLILGFNFVGCYA